MKVLAIHCLNNKDEFTNEIFSNFISGIKEFIPEVFCLDISDMSINKCLGCTEGWLFESPGYCLQIDDMNEVYHYFKESDLWIFSTSINSNGVNGCFSNLLDRLEPLFLMDLDEDANNPNRARNGKVVLLSFSENSNIQYHQKLVKEFIEFCNLYNKQFVGALVRPNTKAFFKLKEMGLNSEKFYLQAKDTGRYLAKNGELNDTISVNFSFDILTQSAFIDEIFNHIKSKI